MLQSGNHTCGTVAILAAAAVATVAAAKVAIVALVLLVVSTESTILVSLTAAVHFAYDAAKPQCKCAADRSNGSSSSIASRY
jgi:hypothetical protein